MFSLVQHKNKNKKLFLLTNSNTKRVVYWDRRILSTDFTVIKTKRGKKHGDKDYAVIEYDGIIPFKKELFCHGKISFSTRWNVFAICNTWYFKDDSYVKINYFDNGTIDNINWYNRYDDAHCLNGPASLFYYRSGLLKDEEWWVDGVMHRLNSPAKTAYYENGQKLEEWWKVDGKLHRLDGPAFIYYYESGYFREEIWYIDGIFLNT